MRHLEMDWGRWMRIDVWRDLAAVAPRWRAHAARVYYWAGRSTTKQVVNFQQKANGMRLNPFHWAFDKIYPLIRFYHERISGNHWFDEIAPGLWLGGAPTYPSDYQFLLDQNIDAVMNIRAERADDLAFYQKHGIEHIHFEVLDMGVPTAEMFSEGVEWIHQQLEQGRTVLIHCAKGRGRSAAMLAAYFMYAERLTFDEAHARMREKRPLTKLEARHQNRLEAWQQEWQQ